MQTEFAVLGPETLLVQISLRNRAAWEIELHKSSLQFEPGIEVLQDTVSRLLVNRLFKRPAKAWWSARATARAMLALNGAAKACYFQAHVRAHACVRQLRMRFARWRSGLRHESRKNAMAVHALHAWQRLAATRAVRALQRAPRPRLRSGPPSTDRPVALCEPALIFIGFASRTCGRASP